MVCGVCGYFNRGYICARCGAFICAGAQTRQVVPNPPAQRLKTDRNLAVFVVLTLITLGIYGIVFYCKMAKDINTIASRYDGRTTMNFLLVILLSLLTLGIFGFYWFHTTFDRIGDELGRRGIDYAFDAATFWLWGVLGAFIIVGPFICIHKECMAMNKLCEHYNYYG